MPCTIGESLTFLRVGSTVDIKVGQSKAVEVHGSKVAIFNVDGAIYAIAEVCPHKGGPLGQGLIREKRIVCPWHGAVFCLETGNCVDGPCGEGVRSYSVRIVDGNIEIDTDIQQ